MYIVHVCTLTYMYMYMYIHVFMHMTVFLVHDFALSAISLEDHATSNV